MKALLSEKWINLAALERAAGISKGCLEQYIAGRRPLSEDRRAKVLAVLTKVSRFIDKNQPNH